MISNDKSHFIRPIHPTNIGVKGFGGNMVKAAGRGTLKWKIEDDEGKIHIFTINNALYVTQSSLCILCPQQWAKQANDHYPIRNGTHCIDNADTCELEWNQCKYKCTIPWDPATNTGQFYSAPGMNNYHLYTAMLDATTDMEHFEHITFSTNLYLPNTDHLQPTRTKHSHMREDLPVLFEPANTSKRHLPDSPVFKREENLKDLTSQDIQETLLSPAKVIPNDDHIVALDDQAELLRWNYHLGHQYFKLIKLLATLKILPPQLATINPPKCAGCLYGAMTK